MPYSEFDTLRVKVDRGVAFVTINHPPINLLDQRLRADLQDFARRVATDDTVRVIVFDSADPDFFIAHTDAAPFLGRLTDTPPPRSDRLGMAMRCGNSSMRCRKPRSQRSRDAVEAGGTSSRSLWTCGTRR
jgi:enoyl-CoA hydratase/carnithine racemase